MNLPMKLLRMAGLCLVAMLTMSIVAAGTASAAPVWEGCTTGGSLTKYKTNQCETAESGGSFEWNEIKSTEGVKVKGETLTLIDEGVSSTIQCTAEEEGEGAVGPGNKGRITSGKVNSPSTNCKRITGACEVGKIEEVKAVDLPWQTELVETEKKVQNKLEGTTNGEPGWAVTCKSAAGKITDTCTAESGKPPTLITLERVKTPRTGGFELLVLGTFLNKTNSKAKCSLGGAEKGEVIGQTSTLLISGAGLSA